MRSRKARPIDQLDEHTIGRVWMKERDLAQGPGARLAIDQFDALRREDRQGRSKIVDDKAQVMQRRPPAFSKEASDTGRVVGRLDELDPGMRRLQEDSPHALIRDRVDGTGGQSEDVPVEGHRPFDRGDDHRHVVELAGGGDHPRSPGA